MQLNVKTKNYKANEIFSFRQVKPIPGLPSFFNLQFYSIVKNKSAFVGPGIYIVSFDGKPIYLGKYMGVKHAPFAGNVINLRWSKHIASLTLRGKRLSVSKRALKQSIDMAPKSAIVRALGGTEESLLNADRGCQTTARRINFAYDKWGDFCSLDNTTLERFKFTYIRVAEPDEPVSTKKIRQLVSAAESELLQDYSLPCNTAENNGSGLTNVDLGLLVRDCERRLSELVGDDLGKSIQLQSDDGLVDKVDSQEAVINPFEAKLESTEEWASEFIDKLISHFEEKECVEIHYTKTGKGDLRLRVFWEAENKVEHQNFATR